MTSPYDDTTDLLEILDSGIYEGDDGSSARMIQSLLEQLSDRLLQLSAENRRRLKAGRPLLKQ